MRRISIVIAILWFLNLGSVFGQDSGSAKPFIIHLSHDSDPGALWITYSMTGLFGYYGRFVRTNAKTWDYAVPTWNEAGIPADKMRLIINSSKYQTQFFDLPESKDQDRVINLKLLSRSTVKFTGKVLSQNKLSGKGLEVRISFLEQWLCAYFGIVDCFSGLQPIMSVALDKNGRFKADLPDFASDPVVASLGDKGSFQFFLCDKKSGNTLYGLQPENGRKGLLEIRVAASYPLEQIFIAEPFR